MLALQILTAALDVAFAISLTPSRYRMYAALATASAALALLAASQWPWLAWGPYVVAATYLGAVINRRVEAAPEAVRRPRVPRL